MKHLVMIAYAFPPEGTAGIYRTLRFIRQLPNNGWSPTVVSIKPIQYERFDPGLMPSIPPGTEVVRVKGHDLWQAVQVWRSRRLREAPCTERSDGLQEKWPQRLHNGLRKKLRDMVHAIEASWYHPDMAMPWIANAVDATVELCNRLPIQVLWATAGPVSSLYVAQQSSSKAGIPYVLDFRDAWTITHSDFERRRPGWAIRRDRQGMYKLLQGAQALVFQYDTEAECFWRAYRGALDASRIYIIPNGYEPPIEKFAARAGDKCMILYAGTLPDYRYETLLRSLIVLKQTDPSWAKQLCLRFVGEGTNALGSEAAALDLSDIVDTAGTKSYAEVTRLQREAHALLVLGRPATTKGYELFAGAKLFGYLKAGRPIVGVLPPDETKKILHRVGVRTVADVESVSDITRVLRLVLESWFMGRLSSLVPDPKACEAYSSEQQTATLVRALEGVPSEEPFLPGAQAIPPSLRGAIESEKWLDGG